jgi:hypothetical protein
MLVLETTRALAHRIADRLGSAAYVTRRGVLVVSIARLLEELAARDYLADQTPTARLELARVVRETLADEAPEVELVLVDWN